MPVSADEVRILISKEDSYGVPNYVDGNWYELPIVSEGIAPNAETTLSNLMAPNRQVVDSILNNLTAEGNLDSELMFCPALGLLLESAMAKTKEAGAPVNDQDPENMQILKVGKEQISLCVQKRFPDPMTPPSGDGYLYQEITGMVVNTFSMTLSAAEAVTYSAGLLGKEFKAYETEVITATPVLVDNPTVLRAPDTVELTFGSVLGEIPVNAFDGESLADATARCFSDFSFNINNNYRGIQCIGTLGNKSVAIGRCEIDASGTIHLQDNEILKALLSQDAVSIDFRVQSPKTITPVTGVFDGMFHAFMPRGKFSADPVVAGGTGTDVVNDMTYNAIYDGSEESTLTITWGDGAVATA